MKLSEDRKEELAYEMISLPRFIYFLEEKEPLDFIRTLRDFDCVSLSGQLISPLRKYEEINATAEVKLDLEESDVLKLFTTVNSKYNELLENLPGSMMIRAFLLTFGEIGELLEKYWKTRKEIRNNYDAEIQVFRKYYLEKIQQKLVLENVIGFAAETLRVVSKNITYLFKKRATLLDIFNDLSVSSELPLITARKFYKVLKGYAYFLDYPEEENVMYLFYKGERVTLSWNGNYIDPEFELTQPRENLEDIKKILEISDAKIIRQRQDAEMYMYPPKLEPFDFNVYIWADMIMNNPYVSSEFVINENEKVGRLFQTIYMYYFPNGAGSNLAEEFKAKKLRFTVKANNLIDRSKGGVFLTRMDIKLYDWDEADLKEFIPKLGKLFGLYRSEAKALAAIYNKFIDYGKISLIPPQPETTKKRLKDIEPKLFVPGYPRTQCQFQPQIIQEGEVKDYEEKGLQVMLFPKTDQENLEQRYYVCARHEKNIFPGLQENKLPNKNKYKYIPCCFKDDQRTKGTIYRYYLEPEMEIEKGRRAGFIETNKILLKGQKGVPPGKLKRLFSLSGEKEPIIRIGTSKNPASILECIDPSGSVSEMRNILSRLKEEIFVAAQEMATIGGVDAARKILKDKTAYLDPRIFYSLLEYQFKCRLVLLGRDDFIFPNHTYTFAHFYSEYPIIIAYENYGGDVTRPDFPQWEYFSGISGISEDLYQIYSNDFVRYQVDRKGESQVIQEPLRTESPPINIIVESQYINSYRQTIALNVRSVSNRKKIVTYLLRHPIAPLPLKLAQDDEIFGDSKAVEIDPLPIQYGDRYYMLSGAKPIPEQSLSWMSDFNELRRASNILLEQAKHLSSKGIPITQGKLSEINFKDWMPALRAPEKIAAKLDYSIKLFKRNQAAEFAAYKDYKIIPNRFLSIGDFDIHSDEIISATDERVDWYNIVPLLQRRPVIDDAAREGFYIELDERVYYCKPIKNEGEIMETNINVCIFNTREIFKVGAPTNRIISLLFYLTKVKKYWTFRCFLVTGEYY